jgi:alpha-ketoglutarate-dependent taurine dioxygenase
MTPAAQREVMQLPIVRPQKPAPGPQLPSLIAAERAHLATLQLRHGAILFRGFAVTEPAQLADAIAAAGEAPMRYVGGSSPRTRIGQRVYTSTQLPPQIRIPLHSELAYVNAYPRHLWFCCAVPPAVGGETVLADARQVYRAIDPLVRRRFIARRVRYRCSFHGPSAWFRLLDQVHKVTRSWMEAFETTDAAIAEARCRELGADVHWLASGRLVMEIVRPAAISHPETGEPLWFNFAHLFRLNPRYLGQLRYRLAQLFFVDRETRTQDAHYGDGSEIDGATIDHLFDVLDAQTVSFPWQRGDVLWIDNLLCMHGRNPFRGPRRVLAAMSR